MSLSTQQLSEIVGLGRPVLCVDTCILLDIIRDLTSDSTKPSNARAANELLQAAGSGSGATILLAQHVMRELERNREGVQDRADKALKYFIRTATRMQEVAQIFGAQGHMQASHLEGHVERAQSVLDGLVAAAVIVPDNGEIYSRAVVRSTTVRTPAKPGKDIGDCIVIEAYLEVASMLRMAGQTAPIVFVSSNTSDFTDRTGEVPADLGEDLEKVGMIYRPNLGAATHALILPIGSGEEAASPQRSRSDA